ncbi:hypothetical protein PMI25_003644 [Pseudomonas sp. GM30]|nr:hypothetical protein PMI25_003644 [Pseudomonas sp. GM30]
MLVQFLRHCPHHHYYHAMGRAIKSNPVDCRYAAHSRCLLLITPIRAFSRVTKLAFNLSILFCEDCKKLGEPVSRALYKGSEIYIGTYFLTASCKASSDHGLRMNIALEGNVFSSTALLPEVRITGKYGQRFQMILASSSPSILPGMQMSVITRLNEHSPSSTDSASSAVGHATISRSSNEIASSVKGRNSSSSSTIKTLHVMINELSHFFLSTVIISNVSSARPAASNCIESSAFLCPSTFFN